MEQNQSNNQNIKEVIVKEIKPVCKGCNTRNMVIGALVVVLVAMLIVGAGRAMHMRNERGNDFGEYQRGYGDRNGRMMRGSLDTTNTPNQPDQLSTGATVQGGAQIAPTAQMPVPVKGN